MKSLLLSLILLMFPLPAHQEPEISFSQSYSQSFIFDDKGYVISLSEKDVADTPSWNPAREDPPVSSREAARIAREHLAGYVKNRPDEWDVQGIGLVPLNAEKWIYAVSFQCYNSHCRDSSVVGVFTIIVKMDGSVAAPEIKPREKG